MVCWVSHRTWVPLISGISLRSLTVICDKSGTIKHGWSHVCLDHCVSPSDHRILIHLVLLLLRSILDVPVFLSFMHHPKSFQNMTYSAIEKQHPYERIGYHLLRSLPFKLSITRAWITFRSLLDSLVEVPYTAWLEKPSTLGFQFPLWQTFLDVSHYTPIATRPSYSPKLGLKSEALSSGSIIVWF